MADILQLKTEKQRQEDQITKVTAAIKQLGPELSGLTCFGKCKDGTYVTMTANAMDPATLGYAQSQLSALSARLAFHMDETANEIELPEE